MSSIAEVLLASMTRTAKQDWHTHIVTTLLVTTLLVTTLLVTTLLFIC